MRLQRLAATAASIAVLGLSASGCGNDSSDGSSAQTPVIIEITENAGKIMPDDGRVIEVEVGQEIQLNVSSDVDDEIHVHSEPEHEFEIPAGKDKTFTFTLDTPGTVVVESHRLEITLVKLQVSPAS